MISRIERYKVERSIEDVMEMIDASPMRNDLISFANSVQLTNRAHNAHLAIEQGLKTLIVHAGGEFEETHALLKLFRRLEAVDRDTGTFLTVAFRDAVEFYGYNVNADGFNQFRSLEDYLARVGGQKAFELYRYWTLDNLSETGQDIPPISLPVHRELLQAIALLVGPEMRRTVSQRVDQAIFHAMSDTGHMWYTDTDTKKQAQVRNYLSWFQAQKAPYRFVLKDVVRRKFRVGEDEYTGRVLKKAYERLRQSEDPATRYFINRLEYLPKNSQKPIAGFYPNVEWFNDKETRGMVVTPGGSLLGFVERYADGGWGIEPAETGLARVTDVAETFADAKSYLVDRLTRRIDVKFGNVVREMRIVSDSDFIVPAQRGDDWTDTANVTESYELEFWDDQHGLQSGAPIMARLRHKEHPSLVSVLEGNVCSVDGAKVWVSGSELLDYGESVETD